MDQTTTTSLFDQAEFAADASAWQQRQLQLAWRRAYYDGTIYKSVRDRFLALGRLSPMLGPRLYRGTKALFLMLARSVNVDVGILPGGWALAEDAPAAWQAAISRIFQWSDWARDGVLYTHYGAQCGLVGLKVADLQAQKRVIIQPLDPATFMLVDSSLYQRTPERAYVVLEREDSLGSYEYAEVITPQAIRTFRNGEPYSFDGRPAEAPNPQGRVPIIEVKHIHTGNPYGECTYEHAMPLLDEVNELASYLADIIRKHAEAQWAVIGAEASDLIKSGDNVWFVPAGGDVKAIVAGIDIPGVLEFIRSIRDEMVGGLPELAFDELKSKTQIATATLELQLMELTLKMKRCRPNYDHGLADALRLAGLIGSRFDGSLAVLADEALTFDAERPVLPLDKESQIRIEQQALALEQQRAISAPHESAPLQHDAPPDTTEVPDGAPSRN